MKTINLLITKLYFNSKYGIIGASKIHFLLAQLSVSFIILYWIYVTFYLLRIVFDIGFKTYFALVYTFMIFVIFYFLNRNAWTLNCTEEFINDKENKKILNRMIFIFWFSLVIPTIVLTFAYKN